MSNESDFISSLGLNSNGKINRSKVKSEMRIAYIDPNYSGSGNPQLRFAGETSVGTRQYPYLSSYIPAKNDKVVVLLFSHSGVILGAVGAVSPEPSPPTSNGYIEYENAYVFSAPASDQYVFLGRLPVSSSSTYDKLLVEVVGSTWSTPDDITKDWFLFSNRGGFAYTYELRGQGNHSSLVIKTYSNTDGSVDVYAYSATNLYNASILRVTGIGINTSQQGPYEIGTQTTTVPSGTVNFDSSSSSYVFNGEKIPTWNVPTYQNGYTDFGSPYGPVKYTKTSNGIVFVKGLTTAPSSGYASGQTIFTLPSGYRPGTELIFVTSSNDGYFALNVDTSGNVITRNTPAGGAWISLDPISFIAEQ